jgi:hypothetical protein
VRHHSLRLAVATVGTGVLLAMGVGFWTPSLAALSGTTRWVNSTEPVTTAPGTSCAHPGYSTIEAAIAASSSGDTIRVCPGTYTETAPVSVANLTLEGSNPSWYCASSMTAEPTYQTIVDSTGPDGIVLDANGITFKDFWVQDNSEGPGVTTSSLSSGYTFDSDVFYNNVFGLYFNSDGSMSSTVQNSCFASNDQSGPVEGAGIYEDQGLTNATISRNSFANVYNNVNNNVAIILVGSSRVSIDHNISNSTAGLLGLFPYVSGGANNDDVVSNNLAINSPNVALYVCEATATQFDQNIVYGSWDGLYVDGVIDGCTESTDLNINQNLIEKSQISGSLPTSGYGFYAASDGLSGSTIDYELITNSAADGIYTASGGNTFDYNQSSNSGGFDCHDITAGTGTAGTDNMWSHDQGKTSSPQGICEVNKPGFPF